VVCDTVDTESILVDGHVYEGSMTKTKGELVQWLYYVLDTGNINSISVDTFNKNYDGID